MRYTTGKPLFNPERSARIRDAIAKKRAEAAFFRNHPADFWGSLKSEPAKT